MYIKELKTLGLLGMPIMITQLAQMGMSVADAIMAGRVSSRDLAGVALGGNLYWPAMLFMSGVIMSLTPTVSQLSGAGKSTEAGAPARQALWIAIIGGAIFTALMQFAAPFYRFVGIDPQALPIAAEYVGAASLGMIPVLCYASLRYLCEGLAWTKPAMVIAFSALALKLPLNYWFIYGGWGVPAMGGVGCGYATTTVTVFQLIAMVLVVKYSRIAKSGVFSRFEWPDFGAIRHLLRIGLPIGAAMFFEMAMFSVITLLIGRLGYEAVAAHQIAGNVGGITFMIPLALGMAATIRVGTNVGAGDYAAARRSGIIAVIASVTIGMITATALLIFRHDIASLYTKETEVAASAAGLMLLVALYQLFDNSQVTGIGSLRGYKDTRAPMFIALVSYWIIGLPIAAMLGIGFAPLNIEPMGVQGFWIGLVIGLAVAAMVIMWRMFRISGSPKLIAQFATR